MEPNILARQHLLAVKSAWDYIYACICRQYDYDTHRFDILMIDDDKWEMSRVVEAEKMGE